MMSLKAPTGKANAALDHKDSYPVAESYLIRLQQLAFEDWFEELKNSAEIEPVDPLP